MLDVGLYNRAYGDAQGIVLDALKLVDVGFGGGRNQIGAA